MPILWYAQARLFRHLANEHNFWNRCSFLKKHPILSKSLKESFSGTSVKTSDFWAFMHQSIETTAPEPRDIAGNLTFTQC